MLFFRTWNPKVWLGLVDTAGVPSQILGYSQATFFPGVKLSKNGIHKALQGIAVVVLPHRKLTSVTQKSHVAGFASHPIQKMLQNHLKIQLFHLKNGCMLQLLQQQPKEKLVLFSMIFLNQIPHLPTPPKKALPHYRWLVWHSAYQWRPGSKETVDFSSSSVASNLVTSPDVWCRSFSEWFDFS